MGGRIALPALGVRPPQTESPMDRMGRLVHLKSLMQGQQYGQLRLEEAQQQKEEKARMQREQKILQQAFMESNGDDEKTISRAIQLGASPQIIQKYRESVLESKTKLADLATKDLDASLKRIDTLGSAAQAVMALPPEARPQGYGQARQSLIQAGVIPPEGLPEQYPGDQWVQLNAMVAVKSKDQLTEERQRRSDAETKRHNLAMELKKGEDRLSREEFTGIWLEAQNLPKNAKTEIQAWNAYERMGKDGQKLPSPVAKAVAARTLQRAKQKATDTYRKAKEKLTLNWRREGGIWYNEKDGTSMTEDERNPLLQEIEINYRNDLEDAQDNYLLQLEALGAKPEEAAEPRDEKDPFGLFLE